MAFFFFFFTINTTNLSSPLLTVLIQKDLYKKVLYPKKLGQHRALYEDLISVDVQTTKVNKTDPFLSFTSHWNEPEQLQLSSYCCYPKLLSAQSTQWLPCFVCSANELTKTIKALHPHDITFLCLTSHMCTAAGRQAWHLRQQLLTYYSNCYVCTIHMLIDT